jgi:hypothetical protein
MSSAKIDANLGGHRPSTNPNAHASASKPTTQGDVRVVGVEVRPPLSYQHADVGRVIRDRRPERAEHEQRRDVAEETRETEKDRLAEQSFAFALWALALLRRVRSGRRLGLTTLLPAPVSSPFHSVTSVHDCI